VLASRSLSSRRSLSTTVGSIHPRRVEPVQ
jgi:hypothetical protein